jgi:hypothetical protein
VWVPAACESGGLVGMVNTNLEKMPAETRQQVLPGQRLPGAMAYDRAATLIIISSESEFIILECRPIRESLESRGA